MREEKNHAMRNYALGSIRQRNVLHLPSQRAAFAITACCVFLYPRSYEGKGQ